MNLYGLVAFDGYCDICNVCVGYCDICDDYCDTCDGSCDIYVCGTVYRLNSKNRKKKATLPCATLGKEPICRVLLPHLAKYIFYAS